MKLNTKLREEFVEAAMRDVPTIDYVSQGIDAMMKKAVELLPADVRAVYKIKPEYVARRTCGESEYIGADWVSIRVEAPCGTDAHQKEIGTFASAHIKLMRMQMERLGALRAKLAAVAKACKTSEALVQTLPEFEKYVPTEATPVSNALVANMAAEFVAAGWPKGKQPVAETTT